MKLQIPTENRMNVHKNARLTPRGRERIVRQVESGQTPEAVAQGPFENGLIGTVAKAWRDCTIGHHGRIDCGSRRLKRWSRRSSSYADSAGQASKSPPRRASHQLQSAVFCVGWG